MAKRMIIKGVGTFMAKRASKDGKGVEVITLGSLQDLQINLNVEIEDIFGGDGLFAIDTIVTAKSIEITATDAKFDLDQMQLMMGSTVQEQVNSSLWVLNEQAALVSGDLDMVTPGTEVAVAEASFGASLFGDGNFQVRLKDDNKLLTKVAFSTSAEPGEDEFMVQTYNTSGATPVTKTRIILNSAHINKDVTFNYQRAETVDLVDILVDEVPFPVHVIHHGSFLQKDGTFQGVETELYSCIANGQFSINAQRATASAASVQLRVIDPERADGKLGSIKRYSANKKV